MTQFCKDLYALFWGCTPKIRVNQSGAAPWTAARMSSFAADSSRPTSRTDQTFSSSAGSRIGRGLVPLRIEMSRPSPSALVPDANTQEPTECWETSSCPVVARASRVVGVRWGQETYGPGTAAGGGRCVHSDRTRTRRSGNAVAVLEPGAGRHQLLLLVTSYASPTTSRAHRELDAGEGMIRKIQRSVAPLTV